MSIVKKQLFVLQDNVQMFDGAVMKAIQIDTVIELIKQFYSSAQYDHCYIALHITGSIYRLQSSRIYNSSIYVITQYGMCRSRHFHVGELLA